MRIDFMYRKNFLTKHDWQYAVAISQKRNSITLNFIKYPLIKKSKLHGKVIGTDIEVTDTNFTYDIFFNKKRTNNYEISYDIVYYTTNILIKK